MLSLTADGQKWVKMTSLLVLTFTVHQEEKLNANTEKYDFPVYEKKKTKKIINKQIKTLSFFSWDLLVLD